MTLSAISVERYFVICHPLKLRIKNSGVAICIAGIWLTGCLVSLPELIYQTLKRTLEEAITGYLSYCKLDMRWDEIKAYQLFLFVTLYIVPMCLMAFAYTNISYRLWRNDIPGNDEQSKWYNDRCNCIYDSKHHQQSEIKENAML